MLSSLFDSQPLHLRWTVRRRTSLGNTDPALSSDGNQATHQVTRSRLDLHDKRVALDNGSFSLILVL